MDSPAGVSEPKIMKICGTIGLPIRSFFFFFFNEGGLGFPDIKGGKKDNGTDYRF